jgi:two-component system LytT family sensor kinase
MTIARSYLWILLSPAIFWLTRRFSFAGDTFRNSMIVHVMAGLLCAFTKLRVDNLMGGLMPTISNASSIAAFQLCVLVYWAIVGASLAFYYRHYYNEYQKGKLLSAQLETRLAETQLHLLKMQLHPHFLFNTLNAISTLVYKDPAAADRMISRLSDLLRFAVDSVRLEEIPLHREIELLETYLDIERTRFGNRLQVALDLDPRANGLKVPSLILQPLVENAIRHGVGLRARGGRVDVRTRLANRKVEIEIQDDGVGFSATRKYADREGVGLANTRARLHALYGSGYSFECNQAPEHGALVRVTIPYYSAEVRA